MNKDIFNNILKIIKSKIGFLFSILPIVIIIFTLLDISLNLFGQQKLKNKYVITFDENEKWWGGNVVDASSMPYGNNEFFANLLNDIKGNQAQPLLISNKGKYIWSEQPFSFKFENGKLEITTQFSNSIEIDSCEGNIKETFKLVSNKYFPPSGKIPAEELFTLPQYNTWIELLYDQSQEAIMKYANSIIENDYPAGVIMIDDNWNIDYGNWKFKPEKFSNPKSMIDELHKMGFKVMLWICPFVSPDSPTYRELKEKSLLLCESNHEPIMVKWWNGFSAVLDLSNPEAVEWFDTQLQYLVNNYNIDGFKFDAGDPEFYSKDYRKEFTGNEHTKLFSEVGINYLFNEYRASWKMGGKPLAQRLRDKQHSWEDLNLLIPGLIAQGLMGYTFNCPDMIGGGEFKSFLNIKNIDEELVIRSAQCQALAPMMQFSVAPWRILSEEGNNICREMAKLHKKLGEEILSLAKHSASTGEPILRSLDYEFPNSGFEEITNQFMLGSNLLVAPVLKKGQREVLVKFPNGTWQNEAGKIIVGPNEKMINSPLEKLIWYKKIKSK